MKKLQLPKIKLKVNIVVLLWAVMLAVILLEAAVLYKYLYLNPRAAQTPVIVNEGGDVRVNLPVYQNVVLWLKDSAAFAASGYSLEKETTGRENPFTEYR